jgi:uncharacterized membrane protein
MARRHEIVPARDTPRHPIHTALASFPAVCFTLVLLTDIAYWRTANLMWHNFSSWLLLVGLVTGALSIVAGAIDFMVRRRRSLHGGWLHAALGLVVLLLALLNSLVHAGDGWTGVVPYGLLLSGLTVVLMIAAVWFGRSVADDHEVEVRHA